MMVILIGFALHRNIDGTNSLPELMGNYVDLYNLYNYFKEFDCQIQVMTDLENPEQSPILIDAVDQHILPPELLTFGRTLSWAGRLHVFKSAEDFDKLLITKDKNTFVYFSGHCKNGNFILPQEGNPPFDTLTFRRKVEDTAGGHFFFVLDCCDSDGTKLPFIFDGENKVFRFNQSAPSFTLRKTLCLSSSQKGQDSGSKITGSLFTHCFLNRLRALQNNLSSDLSGLVLEINIECSCYQQTATLYASFPNLNQIWSWLYGKDK